MWRWLETLVDVVVREFLFVLADETGGGRSEPQQPTIIPPPAAPSVSQTARESLQSQLEFNPQLVAQQAQLQSQYAPQFAQSQYDVANQYGPMYKALLTGLFPELGTLQGQVGQELSSPTGLNPQQQSAQDAIRQRAYDQSAQGVRESANVGGTLFGGRRELREDRARNELAQGFASQDIQLQQQNRDRALRELVTLLQLASPQVQQPGVPSYGQSVVPGGDNLYNALVQNQGNFGVMPGGSGGGGGGGFWDAATMWYRPSTYGF